MFRRASSVFMPSDAEKANRANEKKKAQQLAEMEKEIKLERRRSRICLAANNVVPLSDTLRSPTKPVSPVEPTGETPFKGMKRINPLDEKKNAEKLEEERILQQISDERNINMSQAKVLLAQNPQLAKTTKSPTRSTHRRSVSHGSLPKTSPPISPAHSVQRHPKISETSQEIRAEQRQASSTNIFSEPRTNVRMQALELAVPIILSEAPRRPILKRIETRDSIDTTLITPRSARFSDMILEDSMRSLGISEEDNPVSPSVSTFGGAKSAYTASIYSPDMHQNPDEFPEHLRTPRTAEVRTGYIDTDDMLRIRAAHAHGIATQVRSVGH